MKGISLVVPFGMLLGFGCGGSSASPVEYCDRVAETQCTLVYQCYTDAQRTAAGYPATEAACVTQIETALGCSAVTSANVCTSSNAVYHGEAVDGCISQAANLSCAEFSTVGSTTPLESVAPKCAEVCVIPG